MTMNNTDTEYRVLARKYRPSSFADLLGQDALVRTLKNALASGRLAQAYILTGIRGVGKTTSARIIAKALNCVGPDGKGGMTAEPCGVCEHCRAITADRDIDVVEIDAASNNGIENVREIIEATKYNPTGARFKVYIIDEVHMLSKSAFNALLKTLEEPPARVKFIFATTEIRKVPTTILSRCQRFDLRRVETDVLIEHFKNILQKEGFSAQEDALKLLARASDGSVRDGLSLLDQAIAHSGGKEVTADFVRSMIGLADKGAILNLFAFLMKGDAPSALKLFEEQYALGSNPLVLVQDLLDLTHWLTRAKITPEAIDDGVFASSEKEMAKEMAVKFPMSLLARVWQMLLKGLKEIATAPSEKQATEMLFVRLAYMVDLPSPAELENRLRYEKQNDKPVTPSSASFSSAQPSLIVTQAPALGNVLPAVESVPVLDATPKASLTSFADVVALAYQHKDFLFAFHLQNFVSLVSFEFGRIEFFPLENAPLSLAQDMQQRLTEWTGKNWLISVVNKKGAPSMREEEKQKTEQVKQELMKNKTVATILQLFPNTKIDNIRFCGQQEDDDETASLIQEDESE